MADTTGDGPITFEGQQITHPNLYIRNIPPQMDQTELEIMFRKFGSVTGCKYFKTAPVPYAFLRMSTPTEALAAIKAMNAANLRGKLILVKPADTDATYDSPNENLYVRNIPSKWTEETIRQYFEKFGSTTSVRLMPAVPGTPGLAAMVRFASLEAAQAARDGANAAVPAGEKFALNVKFADNADEKARKQQSRANKFANGVPGAAMSVAAGHRFSPYPGGSSVMGGPHGHHHGPHHLGDRMSVNGMGHMGGPGCPMGMGPPGMPSPQGLIFPGGPDMMPLGMPPHGSEYMMGGMGGQPILAIPVDAATGMMLPPPPPPPPHHHQQQQHQQHPQLVMGPPQAQQQSQVHSQQQHPGMMAMPLPAAAHAMPQPTPAFTQAAGGHPPHVIVMAPPGGAAAPTAVTASNGAPAAMGAYTMPIAAQGASPAAVAAGSMQGGGYGAPQQATAAQPAGQQSGRPQQQLQPTGQHQQQPAAYSGAPVVATPTQPGPYGAYGAPATSQQYSAATTAATTTSGPQASHANVPYGQQAIASNGQPTQPTSQPAIKVEPSAQQSQYDAQAYAAHYAAYYGYPAYGSTYDPTGQYAQQQSQPQTAAPTANGTTATAAANGHQAVPGTTQQQPQQQQQATAAQQAAYADAYANYYYQHGYYSHYGQGAAQPTTQPAANVASTANGAGTTTVGANAPQTQQGVAPWHQAAAVGVATANTKVQPAAGAKAGAATGVSALAPGAGAVLTAGPQVNGGAQQQQSAAGAVGATAAPHAAGQANRVAGAVTATPANGVANGGGGGYNDRTRIMIQNLPMTAEKVDMYEHFSCFGPITSVHITRGFAVVEYASRDAAVRAASMMNNTTVLGSVVKVNLSE